MHFWNYLKKTLLLSLVLFVFFNFSSPSYAQSVEYYLARILEKVDTLPDALKELVLMATSWIAPDKSEFTGNIQEDFSNLGQLLLINAEEQKKQLAQINADLFNQPLASFNQASSNPKILTIFPPNFLNINDVTYSTLLGIPPLPKTASPTSAYNYVKYASGLSIHHDIPQPNWKGTTPQDSVRYLNYYTTVLAAESFNAYVLNQHIAQKNEWTTIQSSLIAKASNSKWFAEIATQELGIVLRQILMFQSQSYVLLTQLIQTQKQILTAHVMTNSLLILMNMPSEVIMSLRAQGVGIQPSSSTSGGGGGG